jgi:hypothetical protein
MTGSAPKVAGAAGALRAHQGDVGGQAVHGDGVTIDLDVDRRAG